MTVEQAVRRRPGLAELVIASECSVPSVLRPQARASRRPPAKALNRIAIRRIAPPTKVPALAVSPKMSQTQNGARSTSVFDRSASSADGTTRLPKV